MNKIFNLKAMSMYEHNTTVKMHIITFVNNSAVGTALFAQNAMLKLEYLYTTNVY